MTDCFPGPFPGPPPCATAAGAAPPDGARLRRSRSGDVEYVTLAVAEGTRLEAVMARMIGIEPYAVFEFATGGAPTQLVFRVDDPDRAEASRTFTGFVSGGMSNAPVTQVEW